MQSLGCMWIEDSRKNNLQSKEGYRGCRQQEALRSLQTDYKAKLHRFWHLLMQIAWPVSFSNFHCAADDHILLNAPDLFQPGTGWEMLRVLSAFDAWWHANSPLLGATICPLGVWRLMLLLLAAAKQVGLRCSQGFARSTGDVRQPGRLVSGGYPGRRLVCSRASSMYWFKVSFLRWGPEGLGKLLMLSAKEKGKHLRKLEYI